MSNRTLAIDERLHAYLLEASLREPVALARLRAETMAMERRDMQIAPEQGQFMHWLLGLMGARRVLEIGTFTCYSAAWMALALPAEGRVVALDVSEEFTSKARPHWRAAGVDGKIDLRIAPALESLPKVKAEFGPGSFDFAFIDADKLNYLKYYEHCLELVRPGGVVAFDNVLRDGRVADPQASDEITEFMRELNRKLHADTRVELTLVPIGDGLTLARRR